MGEFEILVRILTLILPLLGIYMFISKNIGIILEYFSRLESLLII